jgi:hypothetical protein
MLLICGGSFYGYRSTAKKFYVAHFGLVGFFQGSALDELDPLTELASYTIPDYTVWQVASIEYPVCILLAEIMCVTKSGSVDLP